MTPEQRKAVYDYTDEGYKCMNGYLRTGEGHERYKRQAYVLHETLKETKVPKDIEDASEIIAFAEHDYYNNEYEVSQASIIIAKLLGGDSDDFI